MAFRQIIGASAAILSFVAAAILGSASAQNYDGSGVVRFGGFLQGSMMNQSVERLIPGSSLERGSADFNALGLGIAVGLDQRLGAFLIGFEADLTFDNGSGKFSPDEFNADYYATVRGRLGFMLDKNWLVYATAGYAMLAPEFKGRGQTVSGGGTVTLNKEYTYMSGWTAGGGLEYDYGPMVLFAEYLYADYGNWSFPSRITNGRYSVDATANLVRGGIKFKLGHDFAHDIYVPRW